MALSCQDSHTHTHFYLAMVSHTSQNPSEEGPIMSTNLREGLEFNVLISRMENQRHLSQVKWIFTSRNVTRSQICLWSPTFSWINTFSSTVNINAETSYFFKKISEGFMWVAHSWCIFTLKKKITLKGSSWLTQQRRYTCKHSVSWEIDQSLQVRI